MITRNTEVTNPFEKQLLAFCCQQEIAHTIVPALQKMATISIATDDDLARFIHLLEKLIKSAAVLQKLLHMAETTHIVLRPHEIKTFAPVSHDIKFQQFISLYLMHQGKISDLLLSPENLLGRHVEVAVLEKMLEAASAGIQHVKQAFSSLPTLTKCDIHLFNRPFLQFLKNAINDKNDNFLENLVQRNQCVSGLPAPLMAATVALSFRLYLMLEFFNYHFGVEILPPDNGQENFVNDKFASFLWFLVSKNYHTARPALHLSQAPYIEA